MNQDWYVECSDCGAAYTPKTESEPERCYDCNNGDIYTERIQ